VIHVVMKDAKSLPSRRRKVKAVGLRPALFAHSVHDFRKEGRDGIQLSLKGSVG
jgi:hypothetical protein